MLMPGAGWAFAVHDSPCLGMPGHAKPALYVDECNECCNFCCNLAQHSPNLKAVRLRLSMLSQAQWEGSTGQPNMSS